MTVAEILLRATLRIVQEDVATLMTEAVACGASKRDLRSLYAEFLLREMGPDSYAALYPNGIPFGPEFDD